MRSQSNQLSHGSPSLPTKQRKTLHNKKEEAHSPYSLYSRFIIYLGLRFKNIQFVNKIFKNAVKRLKKLQFSL
jgi:hypothetical protein